MKFDLDFPLLIKRLLPPVLRKEKTVAWLETINAGIKTLYNDFLNYRLEVLKRLQYNSQRKSLESILNDKFDPVQRGIYIETVSSIPLTYIYSRIEPQEIYFFNRIDDLNHYFFTRQEYNTQTQVNINFIVKVPLSVVFDEDELKSIVNLYRYAGMRFAIQTY